MATKTKAKRKVRVHTTRVRQGVKRAARNLGPGKAAHRIRETWSQTVASLASAEAAVEKQVRRLLRRNRIGTKDAATLLRDVNALVTRERKKAGRRLESRLSALQARARKERAAVARMARHAAQGALAALNIPSRKEVQDLTRKVDQLSRKIGSHRR